ncbi:MAG: hypothetical protein A3D28_05480 [Omnitrophica bacterium RIFCSPHIGHO2_02_FULL_63_14]|nr:MAG: hypothetical protein A3D28_05480 [Omnitrophica bacterium RIFCSPHIGHO2_02_FULL_63_14]
MRLTATLLGAFLLWAFAPCAGAGPDAETFLVTRVIDGDTLELRNGERVRLIGIDAPEYRPWDRQVEPYGREASLYARRRFDGKTVRLEYDTDLRDNYGRLLAYVYDGDEFMNEALIEEGYARAVYFRPNGRYYSRLKAAERRARGARKGLWGAR